MPQRELTPEPTYAPVLLTIESLVHFMDESARREGVILNDMQVLGVIQKAASQARGREVKMDCGENLRDNILFDLYNRLIQTPSTIFEEIQHSDGVFEKRPLRKVFWRGCLNTILHAARLHKSPFPGTRRYLDYLRIFIAARHHP